MIKKFFRIFISTIYLANFLTLKFEAKEKYCQKEINDSLKIFKPEVNHLKKTKVVDINNDNKYEILITKDINGGGNCCPPKIEIIFFNYRCNFKRESLNELNGVWDGWEDVKFRNIKHGLILEFINNKEGINYRNLDVEIVKYLFNGDSIRLFSKRIKEELEAITEIRTESLDINTLYSKK